MSGFIVDLTSLLSIIDGMKGLNCYAPSGVPIDTKDGFLQTRSIAWLCVQWVPGDFRFGPFFNLAAAGRLPGMAARFRNPRSAAVVFSRSIPEQGGLQSFQLSYPSCVVLAARRFFVGPF